MGTDQLMRVLYTVAEDPGPDNNDVAFSSYMSLFLVNKLNPQERMTEVKDLRILDFLDATLSSLFPMKLNVFVQSHIPVRWLPTLLTCRI